MEHGRLFSDISYSRIGVDWTNKAFVLSEAVRPTMFHKHPISRSGAVHVSFAVVLSHDLRWTSTSLLFSRPVFVSALEALLSLPLLFQAGLLVYDQVRAWQWQEVHGRCTFAELELEVLWVIHQLRHYCPNVKRGCSDAQTAQDRSSDNTRARTRLIHPYSDIRARRNDDPSLDTILHLLPAPLI
jgi:hypothetical protein